MRPILLEKKKWKPEIKDSWMTFFSSIVKVFKKNWLSSSPLQCIVKVFNKSLIFSYVSLAPFSSNTDIWYYFSTLSIFNRNTRDEDENCCYRWWRKVRSRNKTKARSRTRGPTANIRSSTFFGTKISGLQLFLERKYQVFEIGFDAYNVLSLLHLMHPWYMYQVTFCYNLPFCVLYFVNLASPSEGMSL